MGIRALTSVHLPSAAPSFGTTFLKRPSRSDEFFWGIFMWSSPFNLLLSFLYLHSFILTVCIIYWSLTLYITSAGPVAWVELKGPEHLLSSEPSYLVFGLTNKHIVSWLTALRWQASCLYLKLQISWCWGNAQNITATMRLSNFWEGTWILFLEQR